MNRSAQDHIWKALSDPTRRGILEFLRRDSKTTTEIVEHFPDLTRFNVMKHLDVLRSCGFVDKREDGRRRINSLNPLPLKLIYENWIKGFGNLGIEESSIEKSEREKARRRISVSKKRKDFGWKHYSQKRS